MHRSSHHNTSPSWKTWTNNCWNATFGKCAVSRAPARAPEQLSDTACRMRDFNYMRRLSLHVGVTPVCNNQVCERHAGCTRLMQRRMEMQAPLDVYSKNSQGSQQLGQRHPAAEHRVGCANGTTHSEWNKKYHDFKYFFTHFRNKVQTQKTVAMLGGKRFYEFQTP